MQKHEKLVEDINLAKFVQNKKLGDRLRSTHKYTLYECGSDTHWTIGLPYSSNLSVKVRRPGRNCRAARLQYVRAVLCAINPPAGHTPDLRPERALELTTEAEHERKDHHTIHVSAKELYPD